MSFRYSNKRIPDPHNPLSKKSVKVRYALAIDALEKFLYSAFKCHDDERCEVYASYEPGDGIRIEEICFSHATPSSITANSYQRDIPEHSGVILVCESYLRVFGTVAWRPDGWDDDIDEVADAEWRIKEVAEKFLSHCEPFTH